MFCEENLGRIKFRAFPKRVGPQILLLESADYFGTSEHYCVVEIEALEFLCIYTCVQQATADVFPVVAYTRTKSIQKQIKSIDVDKLGGKKPLAIKSCFVQN